MTGSPWKIRVDTKTKPVASQQPDLEIAIDPFHAHVATIIYSFVFPRTNENSGDEEGSRNLKEK